MERSKEMRFVKVKDQHDAFFVINAALAISAYRMHNSTEPVFMLEMPGDWVLRLHADHGTLDDIMAMLNGAVPL